MSKKVGLYIRVSTENQASIDEGSLISQEQRLREWINFSNNVHETDYETFQIYSDIESGSITSRPEYQRMLNDIRKGYLNVIAAISISRLNRSLVDFYELHELCEAKNVVMVSLKEQFDTRA